MKMKLHKLFCLFLTAVLLLPMAAPAALAVSEASVISIRSAADLISLAGSCSLDTWSQGKTVRLEADIDLTGTGFTPIPTFGGSFEGQGHTISGLSITGGGSVQGLFRYIQPSGTVQDLTVEGSAVPTGRKNTLGGIAGSNRGTLSGCTFSGTITGTDSIGGIVGINEAEGQIINCTFSGSVTGQHYVGGIAGQNFGSIIQCENSGSINTTEVEADPDPGDLNRDQINAAENVPVCTDIGGIAGYSSGILQSCANTGSVGYAHMGYNIGGIVGRQSGYLDGCTNSGAVRGRKDVGGIAGQLEPEVRLLYNEGTMGQLLDELDVLRDQANSALDDFRSSSDQISNSLQSISDRAKETQGAADALIDSSVDWANGNIDEINSLTARISWLVDEITPVLDSFSDVMDLAEELSRQLDDVLYEAGKAADLGEDAADQLHDAAQALRTAAARGREAADHLKEALDALRNALGRPEDTAAALEELSGAAAELSASLSEIMDGLSSTIKFLWKSGILAPGSSPDDEALQAALDAVQTALSGANDAVLSFVGAVTDMALAGSDPGKLEKARQALQAAADDLAAALRSLSNAAGDVKDSFDSLRDLLHRTGNAVDELRDASDTIQKISSRAADLSEDLHSIFQELSEQPEITIHPIDSTLQEQGDQLSDSISDLLESGDNLEASLSSASDSLTADLEAITDQLGVITDLLRDLYNGSEEDPEDRFVDVSDQEPESTGTGVLSGSRNTGTVEGDINTAGIAGSMAIEYDFDPEDDLIEEGDRSPDFLFQTKASVLRCVNAGEVSGKRDYTGGVVGRMDLGRVGQCESYGDVSSTDGSYVGGIAGASWGSIRDSWAKCRLSGEDYVGGIAGLGFTLSNCHTLVEIDEADSFPGAIAGDLEPDGTVSGNTFTSETLGGVDGISYAGTAEPVDFDTLCATSGAPENFSSLDLTFQADGRTVAIIPFQYGGGIDALPEIPEKEGFTAVWPDLDYTRLTFSQVLEAEYTPYVSALSDGGSPAEILAEGSFSNRASLSHTTSDVSWTDGGTQYTGTAHTVSVEDPELTPPGYTVHFRLPDPGKHYTLWILNGDTWTRHDCTTDGQYLLFPSEGAGITFCVTESNLPLWIILTAAGAVILLAAAAVILKKRRARKHT